MKTKEQNTNTMKTTNNTIATLVNQVKDLQSEQNVIRQYIQEQKKELMAKVRKSLENEGLDLEPKQENHDDIYLPVDSNNQIHIRITSGNFQVHLPCVYKTATAHIQSVIYGVFAKYGEELLDIQLDMIKETSLYKWECRIDLEKAVAEHLFSELLSTGSVMVGRESWTMTEGVRGRYNLTDRNGETKSYFKDKVIQTLMDCARTLTSELLQVK